MEHCVKFDYVCTRYEFKDFITITLDSDRVNMEKSLTNHRIQKFTYIIDKCIITVILWI